MRIVVARLVRSALCAVASGAFITGCGGSQPPIGAPSTNDIRNSLRHHKIFGYTGAEQFFVVPASVHKIVVTALGACGASFDRVQFGLGGRVHAEISVTPGERLAIFVGGAAYETRSGFDVGGFNGGGNSPGASGGGGGGGGASDVRQGGDQLSNRVVVGGGGGGGGAAFGGGNGGAGGNIVGGAGQNRGYLNSGGGGSGGTQSAGGTGGSGGNGSDQNGQAGKDGVLGAGGDGGAGGFGSSNAGGSGGGAGGGYYGGGGGGGGGYISDGTPGGGGAGGSSYVEPSATSVRMRQGWEHGGYDGQVAIYW